MRLLRTNPAFRLLWLANLAASVAGWSLGIALSVQVFTVTGSSTATAGLLVAATVPAIGLASLGGVAADRIRRDRVLKLIGWLRVVTVASLIVVGRHPAGLYGVAFLQSAQMQFFTPAEQATVADVVTGAQLPAALSANSVAGNTARLAGPALGGFLVTWTGFTSTVVAICGSLAAAAWLLSFLPKLSHGITDRRAGIIRDWIDGLHVIATHPRVRAVAVFQILDSAKEGPFTALFPVLMLGTIGTTAGYMGTVNSSFAVTAVLGAPLVSLATRRFGYRWPIAGGAAICGGLLLLLAVWPTKLIALVTFLTSGLPFTISWVAANTWLLTHTDTSHRGRVTGAVATLDAAATAAFAAIAGAATQIIPVTIVLAAAAVVQALAAPIFLIMTRHSDHVP